MNATNGIFVFRSLILMGQYDYKTNAILGVKLRFGNDKITVKQ